MTFGHINLRRFRSEGDFNMEHRAIMHRNRLIREQKGDGSGEAPRTKMDHWDSKEYFCKLVGARHMVTLCLRCVLYTKIK